MAANYFYFTLVQKLPGTLQDLAQYMGFSRAKVTDALQVIAGTGVIHQLDNDYYTLGSRLFTEWVKQQNIHN
jgi:DNA-binding IclR family transcriptional regulator